MLKRRGSGVSDDRRLKGPQTTGREYRNLSEIGHEMVWDDDVAIETRDGTRLLADIYRPKTDGRFPVLVSASCYPRQIQDIEAPMGFIEAGASDFFVPRGYVHVIANLRGTGGSDGSFSLFDETEREDLYDIVEWAAGQPWSDGNVGMIGSGYYAMTQLEAAVEQPPHLKAIFPVAASPDLYEMVWHHGLLNSTFITTWITAVGLAASYDPKLWRDKVINLVKKVLKSPKVHARLDHLNGEAVRRVLQIALPTTYAPHPWDDLRYAACVGHPVRDEFWDDRNLLPKLRSVDIPVYLACDWDNVPLHLPGTFTALAALRSNPNVRVGVLGSHGLSWPWESLHFEALAWFDHWLKGADTGITDGPPIRYHLDGANEWHTATAWPPPDSALRELALRVDATLGDSDGALGSRDYLCLTSEFEQTRDGNPLALPSHLNWATQPLITAFDMVGDIELQLDATLSASDAGWLVTLLDVAPDGSATNVTGGWLRASLRSVNEAESRLGTPVLDCRHPVAVPPNELVSYRIPLVPTAHRFEIGHRVGLVIVSDDRPESTPTILGFRHPHVTPAVRVGVWSSSRLVFPVL